MHCVRVRPSMGRKQQLQRREHSGPLAFSSSSTSNHANGRDATHQTMYHHHHKSNHQSANHIISTSSPIFASSASEARSTSSTSSTRTKYATYRTNHQDGRRHVSFAIDTLESDICAQVSRSGRHVLAFALGIPTSRDSFNPLLPASHSVDIGSQFSPFNHQWIDDAHGLTSEIQGGARTHSSGGGGSGGGGDSPTGSGDMSPGGGDGGDGGEPSSYTFRRRNAIVEGSEDAPKADDFPDGSPK